MSRHASFPARSRRWFLHDALPAGALACLGCTRGLSMDPGEEKNPSAPARHKFLADSRMTFADVFKFTYQDGFIPLMNHLAKEVGREKLVKMLKQAASEASAERMAKRAEEFQARTPADFISPLQAKGGMVEHVLTLEVVEENKKAAELKVTECLWAKAFRAAQAADIGYAVACFPDYASARAFNPKMKMVRSKTLMEGHDCCNHRFIIEG